MSPVPVSISAHTQLSEMKLAEQHRCVELGSGEQSGGSRCGDKRDVNEFDTDIEKTSGNGQARAKNIALIKLRIPVFDHGTPLGESSYWGRGVIWRISSLIRTAMNAMPATKCFIISGFRTPLLGTGQMDRLGEDNFKDFQSVYL